VIPLPDLHSFPAASTSQIDWLLGQGVDEGALLAMLPLRCARGHVAGDGRLDLHSEGKSYLVFPEAEDCIFWQPRTGELATWNGRAFALGEDTINNPLTFSFGNHLNLLPDPLEWLHRGCEGIVIVDWSRAYARLHSAPRIAIHESLLFQYRRHMKPPRMPETCVLAQRKAAA